MSTSHLLSVERGAGVRGEAKEGEPGENNSVGLPYYRQLCVGV